MVIKSPVLHSQIAQGYDISRPIPEADLYHVLPSKLVEGHGGMRSTNNLGVALDM
ncbi:MAG: hypothetical protein ACJA13_002835 [Paraglaciecola sp.]|jgi:hypothetical protein